MTRALLRCGALGPPLFVLAFLIEGATRSGYDAWRTTISTLSWGELGWMQAVNFGLFGVLMLAFAAGARRALGKGPSSLAAAILLAIAGAGLIVAGCFRTDPILGYPPGAPAAGAQSLHGAIHNIASLVVFLAIPAACFVLAPCFSRAPAWRGWAAYSMLSGIAILLLMGWFFACVSASMHGASPGNPAGFVERLLSVVGCVWLSLLALKLLSLTARQPIS